MTVLYAVLFSFACSLCKMCAWSLLMCEMAVKAFRDLTLEELYEILRVRCAVFVVEQNCPYQDIDGIDPKSVHVFLKEDGKVLACLRVFMRKDDYAQIGRVVTAVRGKGYGRRIMEKGVEECGKISSKGIILEAQTYAAGFYAKYGFVPFGDEFDEDGIPHIQMIRE